MRASVSASFQTAFAAFLGLGSCSWDMRSNWWWAQTMIPIMIGMICLRCSWRLKVWGTCWWNEVMIARGQEGLNSASACIKPIHLKLAIGNQSLLNFGYRTSSKLFVCCRSIQGRDDMGDAMWFISHHEEGGGVTGIVFSVVVNKLSEWEVLRPFHRIGSAVDAKIGF